MQTRSRRQRGKFWLGALMMIAPAHYRSERCGHVRFRAGESDIPSEHPRNGNRVSVP